MGFSTFILSLFLRNLSKAKPEELKKLIDAAVPLVPAEPKKSIINKKDVILWINGIGSMFGRTMDKDAIKLLMGDDDERSKVVDKPSPSDSDSNSTG